MTRKKSDALNQKVLLIDDSRSIHRLVAFQLAEEAVDLVGAFSAADGLKLAAELLPDVILLDVALPDLNGFQTCRQLQLNPATNSIPVIFLTAQDAVEDKARGLDFGATDYITKPFEPAELRARVRASLRTKRLLDLLARKAQIDGLTGLWNRPHFDQRLMQEVSLRARVPSPLSCIFLDIDHFKLINDRFGHSRGDDVLRLVAQCISDCCRAEDVVSRYGGEEFGVLSPGVDAAGAVFLAERIRRDIAALQVTFDHQPVTITASLGVADISQANPNLLVERADAALYEAKHSGRDCVRVDPQSQSQHPSAFGNRTGAALHSTVAGAAARH